MSKDNIKKKVCVVGAGIAGLCSARFLAAYPETFDFVVFEKNKDIGGTWIYSENIGHDEHGLPIHSSMYKNLRTNIPKEVMGSPDFPKVGDDNADHCCVHHEVFLNYLQDYTSHFEIRKYIKFNILVENIRPMPKSNNENTETWNVKVKNLENKSTEELQFDAVMICIGHHSVPHVPKIIGSETFAGKMLHSHSYRRPEEFRDEKVLLLGANYSGIDIALELTKYASQVYLSHEKEKLKYQLPENIIQVPGVAKINGNSVYLKDKDSTVLTVDNFIYCTGYLYSFPFLDNECGIELDDNYITPLYRHMININHPTMCFINLPNDVIPFITSHMQVQLFVSVLKGTLKLPSREVMMEDIKLQENQRKKDYHNLGDVHWLYLKCLIEQAKLEPLPGFYENGLKKWFNAFYKYPSDVKNLKFVISEDRESARLLNQFGEEVLVPETSNASS